MKSYRRWFSYQHFKQHFFSVTETLLLPPRCKLFDICWEMQRRKLRVSQRQCIGGSLSRESLSVEKLAVTNPVKWEFSLSPFRNDGNRRQHRPSGSGLKRVSYACVCEYASNRCLNTWCRQRVFWRPNGTNHSVQPVSLQCCISLLGKNEPYVTEAHVTHNSRENAPTFPELPHIKECGLEDFTWGEMWIQAINLALFSF